MMNTIYDYNGDPIDTAKLLGEHADDGSVWTTEARPSVATNLTPKRLGALLRAADDGDVDAYLILSEEIEERDLHYRSVLFTRRTAISGLDVEVEAVDETPLQQDIARDVKRLLREPECVDLRFDMMDAIPKGYSLCEILWEDRPDGKWWPRGYRYRNPRWFRVDPITQKGLRLDDGTPDGKELPPAKYVIHLPKLKSGLPTRAGLARPASIAFAFKAYSIRDLARFLEAYGIPARIGRYPASAQGNKALRKKLLNAVRRLGTDAAAILPDDVVIELLEANRGSNSEPFIGTAEFWDRQISKLVLGQTTSSEGGSSDYKESQQHQGVRLSIAHHDGRGIAKTLSRDLVRPFVELNYGPQEEYPRLSLPVPVPEDLTKFTAAVTPFVDRGLRVGQAAVRGKLGLPEPDEEEDILAPRPQGMPQGPMGDTPGGQEPADA